MRETLPTVVSRVGALLERHVPPGVKDEEIDQARDLIRGGRFKEALALL
jgi:hypothetical protein